MDARHVPNGPPSSETTSIHTLLTLPRFRFVTHEVPIIINLGIFQTKHTFWGRGDGSI